MSSVVNKSGIRFAPKIKQRRSATATPNASRRTSITPAPDIARRSIDANASIADEDEDEENSSDEDDAVSTTSTNTTRTLEKSQENRSRRLSTLNNISNRDLFKKVSVQSGYSHDSPNQTERKGQVIGIPQPPTSKRRRSTVSQSRRGSTAKRKSVSEAPGATPITVTPTAASVPPPTVSEHEHENEDEEDPKSTAKLPVNDTQQSKLSSQSQFSLSSSIPIPSTPASSLPTSAPIDPKDVTTDKEPTTETTERPSTAPEQETTTKSTSSTPMPVGVPITRPSTAPASSSALAKAPEDSTTSSRQDSPELETPLDTEPRDEISQDPVTGVITFSQVKTDVKSDPNEPKRTFKIQSISQLPKYSAKIENRVELGQRISIDEAGFTISDLCNPSLRIGKISKDYHQAQEARKLKMAQRRHRRELRQRARENKVSVEKLEEEIENQVKIEEAKKEEDAEQGVPNAEGEEKKGEDNEEKKVEEKEIKLANNSQGIQLKLGADGQLIVDEDSRVLDRHANMGDDTRERYNENPFENVVNSATYGRQRYTDKWSTEEVERFYKALGTWGTDFGLIAQMFPHRTRRQVKSKFILEEKKRPRLIELALNNKLNGDFSFEAYCSDSNKTFGTLDDFNVKLEQLKKDHDENLKELSVAREKAKEEDLIRQKKREEEVKANGGAYNTRPLTRQERLVELRKHETVLGSIDDVKRQREEEEAAAAAAAAEAAQA